MLTLTFYLIKQVDLKEQYISEKKTVHLEVAERSSIILVKVREGVNHIPGTKHFYCFSGPARFLLIVWNYCWRNGYLCCLGCARTPAKTILILKRVSYVHIIINVSTGFCLCG